MQHLQDKHKQKWLGKSLHLPDYRKRNLRTDLGSHICIPLISQCSDLCLSRMRGTTRPWNGEGTLWFLTGSWRCVCVWTEYTNWFEILLGRNEPVESINVFVTSKRAILNHGYVAQHWGRKHSSASGCRPHSQSILRRVTSLRSVNKVQRGRWMKSTAGANWIITDFHLFLFP